jgi:hypothetical protein
MFNIMLTCDFFQHSNFNHSTSSFQRKKFKTFILFTKTNEKISRK